MKNILDSMGLADVLGYWVGSDIFSENYDNSAILFGGCGLLSKDGIKKPSYYAYSFMNQMRNQLVKKGSNYILTTDNFDNYFLACHNYQHLNYKYYLKGEDQHNIDELQQLYESNQVMELDFALNHAKNGRYEIKSYTINDNYGSVQKEWKSMGMSARISKPEIDYLKKVCMPRIRIRECVVDRETLEFKVEINPQEIQFIHVSYLY